MSTGRDLLRRWWPFAAVLFGSGIGCSAPTFTALTPPTGYPRQLLGVQGTTLFASVVWDVGLPSETELYNGWLGTNYFQIPVGATAGVHPVALRNSYGTSPTLNVTVLAPSGVFPAPRIEEVGLFTSSTAGPVDLLISIVGANLDVNATVTVNGVAPPTTVRWGGLPVNYLQAHTPSTFGYPVYHYVQLMNVVNGVALGSALNIVVTNSDGLTADTIVTVPAAVADFDSDNDGLLNTWEQGNFTAPSGNTINLAAMGTDHFRKNILVEVDWIAAAVPNATIWATIETAFADAPVLNMDGSRGVGIIIDRGQGAPFTGGGTVLADHTTMDFGTSTAAGYVDFFTYKGNTTNFNADRLNIFHYGVFGRAMPGGFSGRGEIWGNDFMVTFVAFTEWGTDVAEVGTFLHELGHNLGLRHGGIDNGAADANDRWKPNFASTMNYRYQFPGVSIDCNWTSEGNSTYSRGDFASIAENAVNESVGICDNAALDMNGSGGINPGTVSINFDTGSGTLWTVNDYDQWGNMKLAFRAAGSRWLSN